MIYIFRRTTIVIDPRFNNKILAHIPNAKVDLSMVKETDLVWPGLSENIVQIPGAP